MHKDSIYPYIDLYDSKEQQVFDAIRFTGYNRKSIENFIRQRSSKWSIESFTRNKMMLKKDDYTCRPFAPEPKIAFLVFIKMGNFEGHRFKFYDHSKIENSTDQTSV
jgi:hypothetical protein